MERSSGGRARLRRGRSSGRGGDGEKRSNQNQCLFCLCEIALEKVGVLQAFVTGPNGQGWYLGVKLNDTAKNMDAFDSFCSLFKVRWDREGEMSRIDKGKCLQLCEKCQYLYQELYQLQSQIKELRKLVEERVEIISGIVGDSGRKMKQGWISANGETSWQEYLRRRIISGGGSWAEGQDNMPKKLTKTKRVPDLEVENYFSPSCLVPDEDSLLDPNEILKVPKVETDLLLEDDHEINNAQLIWDGGNAHEEAEGNNDYDDPDFDFVGNDDDNDSDFDGGTPAPPPRRNNRNAKAAISKRTSKRKNDKDDDSSDNDFSSPSDEVDSDGSNDGQDGLQNKKRSPSKKKGSRSTNPNAIIFTCHICDTDVSGREPFFKHYDIHHPEEKRYTCKYCRKHFSRLGEVEAHQSKHTGIKLVFDCAYCPKSFSARKTRNNHQRWEHEGVPKRHSCTSCSKSFATPAMLKAHETVHSEAVMLCKTCGTTFKQPRGFEKHNKRFHNGEAECTEPTTDYSQAGMEALGVVFDTLDATKSPNVTAAKCHICWQNILGKVNVKRHFEVCHNGSPPNVCSHCNKEFNCYKDTRLHVIRVHLRHKPMQCDECPMRFVTATELRHHKVSHLPDEERPKFICDLCGMSYKTKDNLLVHKRLHMHAKVRHVCELCGKSYAERRGYIHHKKSVHLKQKPHKCSYCQKCYVGPSELRQHMRAHMSQKPHKCPHCDKSFPYNHTWRRHIRTVHKKQPVQNEEDKKVEEMQQGHEALPNEIGFGALPTINDI